MTLRIGIIGVGLIGQDHARRLSGLVAGARVAAVADADPARARLVAQHLPGARALDTGHDVIAASDVDAVLVTSSGPTHEEFVLAAIAARKPVFCEKPLAPAPAACLRIIAAEQAAGRRLVQVGFMRRYDQGYRAIKQAIEDRVVGAPLLAHCVHRNAAVPASFSSDMLLTDSAVHEMDVMRWLLGEEITAVSVVQPRRSGRAPGDLQDPQLLLMQTGSGVHIDVEDQRRAQQELLVAQDDLARLSRTLSMAEMAATIAHELNQPLTALVSDAHACRRWLNVQPANVERAVASSERIVRDSTRASEVLGRIRSLFSKSAYVRESTDLNHLIQDLARLLRDESLRRNISIRLRLSKSIPPLMVDSVQIQQVLLNLAANGMEAMAEITGIRELEISSEILSATEVMVTVRDHGVGLAEQCMEKMFDPFFTTKREGIGMGLAICRSIIEAHDGRIWADALDCGAAFHFSLGVNAQ